MTFAVNAFRRILWPKILISVTPLKLYPSRIGRKSMLAGERTIRHDTYTASIRQSGNGDLRRRKARGEMGTSTGHYLNRVREGLY